jgi:hypothetical protein
MASEIPTHMHNQKLIIFFALKFSRLSSSSSSSVGSGTGGIGGKFIIISIGLGRGRSTIVAYNTSAFNLNHK